MNVLFTIILISGTIALVIAAPDSVLSVLIAGSGKGLEFAIKLFAVYAIWLSILGLWSRMGFDSFLAKIISPLLKKLFPKENEKCYADLSINLSANLLGMGSAGTPAGIRAVSEMKENRNRVMLLVVNSTSVQLIPTTVIAIRSAQGATADIILPTLLSTLVTTAVGIVLVEIFIK